MEDGKLALRDASEVWGMTTHETVRFFQERCGEKDLTVIAIGPAGENRVKFAAWINANVRAAGRGGTRAVGGAKRLKVIVVKAEKAMPKPVREDDFRQAHKDAQAMIMDQGNITAPKKGGLSLYGTNMLMNVTASIGALPTLNSQETSFANAELISGEHIRDTICGAGKTAWCRTPSCVRWASLTSGVMQRCAYRALLHQLHLH